MTNMFYFWKNTHKKLFYVLIFDICMEFPSLQVLFLVTMFLERSAIERALFWFKKKDEAATSLVVRWIRIHLPV